MIRILLFILYMINSIVLFAQKEKNLSFELSANKIDFKLKSLNPYFENTQYYYRTYFYPNGFSPTFERGNDFGLNINVGFNRYFSIALQGNFQNLNYKSETKWNSDDFLGPSTMQTYNRIDQLEIRSFLLGVGPKLHVHEFWKNKTTSNTLKRIEFLFGATLGVGFINFKNIGGFYDIPFEIINDQRTAQNIQARFHLDLGYKFINKNIFSSIGFKIGYQNFKTKKLEYSLVGNNLTTQVENISLDLSGFFYGIYLKIGK